MTAVLPYGERFGVWVIHQVYYQVPRKVFQMEPITTAASTPHWEDSRRPGHLKFCLFCLSPVQKDFQKREMNYMHTSKWAHAMETVWWLCNKLYTKLSHGSAIPRLGIIPREMKTGVQTKAWPSLFTAAVLTVAKRGKQPNVHNE